MKDWRGVLIELAILALMAYIVAIDHALAGSAFTAAAALAGTVIQRAKFDALVGTSLIPPPMGGGGGRTLSIPPYRAPPDLAGHGGHGGEMAGDLDKPKTRPTPLNGPANGH